MKVQEKGSLPEYADEIKKNLEERIKKIKAIEYHYDLLEYFKSLESLNEKEQMATLELMINDYLEKFKKLGPDKILKMQTQRDVEDTIDFFDYDYISDEDKDMSIEEGLDFPVCNRKYEHTGEIEEADHTVSDLLSKLANKGGREICLPISIQNIIDYSINNTIPKENMKMVIYRIILDLSVLYIYALDLK